ncbi:dihydroorotase [Patescibacteria group bacterium]|nr:dihydroorotase [Patescibacteria group bacterium]
MKILFKNAHVVSGEGVMKKDVLVSGNVISKMSDSIDEVSSGADKIYDLDGKYLMPGVIDAHVHFRTPGYEEKEDFRTGSMSALAGGVTTVFDMPNTKPRTNTVEAFEAKRALVKDMAMVNYGLFFEATPDNLEEVKKVDGAVGLKVYMASTTGQEGDLDMGSDKVSRMFEELFKLNKYVVAVHAEDEEMIKKHEEMYHDDNDPAVHSLIRNEDVSLHAVKQAVHLAKKYDGRVHICHMSTKGEAQTLAKYHNAHTTCEVTPHHLFLHTDDYSRLENFAKVNPPIRSEVHVKALWEAVSNGVVDMIVTDHAPHLKSEKELGYWEAPSGMPGVETSLPLMLDAVNHGRLHITDVVRLMCENPARVYEVKGKGFVREGYDADLVVVDMELEREVRNEDMHTKCGWTPYVGRVLRGWPVMTFVRGQLGMENWKVMEGVRGAEVVVG